MPLFSHFSINKYAQFAVGAPIFVVCLWFVCGLTPSDSTRNKPEIDDYGDVGGFLGPFDKTNPDTTNAIGLDKFKRWLNANEDSTRQDNPNDYAPEKEATYTYATDATTWYNHLNSLMCFFGMSLLLKMAFDIRAPLNKISVVIDFRLYMFLVSEPITALTTQTVLWYLEDEAGMLMDNNIGILFGMYLPYKTYGRALCDAFVTLMPLIKRTVGFSMMRSTRFGAGIPQAEPVRPLCAVRGESQKGYCLRGVFCYIGVAILVAISLDKGATSNEHAVKNNVAMQNTYFGVTPSSELLAARREWLNEVAGINGPFLGSMNYSQEMGNTTIARGVELTADNSNPQIRMILAGRELTWKVCNPVTDESLKKYCEHYMSNKFPQESGIKEHLSLCKQLGDPELIKIQLATRTLLEEVMNDRVAASVRQQNLKQVRKISDRAATSYNVLQNMPLFFDDTFVTLTVFGHCKSKSGGAWKFVSTQALKTVVGVDGIVTNVFKFVEKNNYKTMFYSVFVLFVNFFAINLVKVNEQCIHMTMRSEEVLQDVLSCIICAVAKLLIFNGFMFYRFLMTSTPLGWQFYCANAVTLSLFGYSMYKKYILHCIWLNRERAHYAGAVANRNFFFYWGNAPAAPAAAEHNWYDFLFSPFAWLSTAFCGGTGILYSLPPAATTATRATAMPNNGTPQTSAGDLDYFSGWAVRLNHVQLLQGGIPAQIAAFTPTYVHGMGLVLLTGAALCSLVIMGKRTVRY